MAAGQSPRRFGRRRSTPDAEPPVAPPDTEIRDTETKNTETQNTEARNTEAPVPEPVATGRSSQASAAQAAAGAEAVESSSEPIADAANAGDAADLPAADSGGGAEPDEEAAAEPAGDHSSRRRRRGKRDEKQGLGSWLFELAMIALVALLISSLIRNFVMEMFIIPSGSMENTLLVNDRVVVIRVTDFHRGDVVVFKDPGGWLASSPDTAGPVRKTFEFLGILPSSTTDHLVKRVIGMPGDHVKCCDPNGNITVNDYPLDEHSYLFSVNGNPVAPSNVNFDVIVPADHIFVLGDHRDASRDSRPHLCDPVPAGQVAGSAAFVPISDVTGPAVAIAMPFDRTRSFTIPATFSAVPAPAQPAPQEPVVLDSSCPS